ncbi:hypothetical protein [Thalassotalea ganghwensis]
MNWEQFNFKSRFFLQRLKQGATLQQAEQAYKSSGLEHLYQDNSSATIQQQLFDQLFQLSNPADVIKALAFFKEISLSGAIQGALLFGRVLKKLDAIVVLSIMFGFFISFFNFYIYPAFLSLTSEYPNIVGQLFYQLPLLWGVGISLTVVVLVISFLIKRFLKRIDRFIISLPNMAMSWFVPKSIKVELFNLNQLLGYALSKANLNSDLQNELGLIAQNGMDVNHELNNLFNLKFQKLIMMIQSYTRHLLRLLYVIIVTAIAFFVMQIYDPIFKLGMIV